MPRALVVLGCVATFLTCIPNLTGASCRVDENCPTGEYCGTAQKCVKGARPDGGSTTGGDSATGDGAAMDGGSALDGGDAGGGPGHDGGVLAECTALMHDLCVYMVACYGGPSLRACEEAYAAMCPGIAFSSARGYLSWSTTEFARCRTDLAASIPTCAPLTGGCPPWAPLVSDGGTCGTSLDCADGVCGDATGACPTTCVAPGGLGMPCDKSDYGFGCASPLHCSRVTGRCENPIAPGQPCDSQEIRACGNSAACTSSICISYPSLDQSCTSNCQEGLLCKADGGSSTCRPVSGEGESCSGSGSGSDCTPGLRCLSGTCQPPRPLGQPCESSSECTDGLLCEGTCKPRRPDGSPCTRYDQCLSYTCDAAFGACVTYSGDRATGQSCGTALRCKTGQCRGMVLPDGGLTPGQCGTPELGDVCSRDAHGYGHGYGYEVCPRGTRCAAPDGGVDTVVGTCQTPGLDSPCVSWGDCRPEHYCDYQPDDQRFTCQPRIGVGATCNTGRAPCVEEAVCSEVSLGTFLCLVPGEGNEPCAETLTPSDRCASGAVCLEGLCRILGTPGGPCDARGCSSGRCEFDGGVGGDSDGGGGGLIGRCLPPGQAGAPCDLDSDCATSRCRDHRCGALCP